MNIRPDFRRRALVILAVGLLAAGPAALAQDSPSSPSSGEPAPTPAPQAGPTADAYAVSLSTGELIKLTTDQDAASASNVQPAVSLAEYADGMRVEEQSKAFRRLFLYGLSLSSAYNSDYAGLGTPSQVTNTISPYLGLLMPTRTGSVFLQYDAVVNPHDRNVLGAGSQAYQTFSLAAQGALSRRWSWTFSSSGGYGSETTRLEAPLTFSVIQNVPILDAGSTVLLPATNVLFVSNTARLAFQENERNTYGFTLLQTYTGIDENPNNPSLPGERSSAVGAKVDYAHLLSQRLTLTSFLDEETVVSGVSCFTYGGGVGISARVTRAVSVDVEGGPQFSSSGCGRQLSGNFRADVVDHLNQQDRVYASVSRQLTTAFKARETWQDNVAAGYAKNMRRYTFAADAGFVRETDVTAPYHGYFVAPRIHMKLVNSLAVTVGYRAFHVVGGGLPSGVVNFAAVSLDWYPAGLRFK